MKSLSARLSTKPEPIVQPVQWLPAERLGQLDIESHLRPWLIGNGLLTARLRAACGAKFSLRLIHVWSGLFTDAQRAALRVADAAGLFREVDICDADRVCVFAQTLIPDSTLSRHAWLAELGDAPLDETLNSLAAVERSSYEYARLPPGDPLATRALRDLKVKAAGLWARRYRVTLRGAPLLMQEAFLPAMGRNG